MASSRLRLALSGRAETGLHDSLTGDNAAIWDQDALDIEFWLGSECAEDEPFDIDLITSISMEVRATDTTSALLIPVQTIAVADLEECDLDDWKADDGEHGVFELTGELMNFANGTKRAWFSFRALLTDGSYKVFGAGYVKIAHHGHGDSMDPASTTTGGFLYVASMTPDSDGMITIQARGYTFRITPSDLTEISDAPVSGVVGGFLYIHSIEPDDDGMITVSARGWTFRVNPADLAAA